MRLKGCNNLNEDCDEYRMKEKLFFLENEMKIEYEKFCNNNSKICE